MALDLHSALRRTHRVIASSLFGCPQLGHNLLDWTSRRFPLSLSQRQSVVPHFYAAVSCETSTLLRRAICAAMR